MTTMSMDLWVEEDSKITTKEGSSWVEIDSGEIQVTLWFNDTDRDRTKIAVDKIDEFTASLLDVRKRLMASLDQSTSSGVAGSGS